MTSKHPVLTRVRIESRGPSEASVKLFLSTTVAEIRESNGGRWEVEDAQTMATKDGDIWGRMTIKKLGP